MACSGTSCSQTMLCYSQVVSAALVTVRSSGSRVGGLLVFRLTCMLTEEPLGGGEVTVLKSGPSTTWTTDPIPVTRSSVEFPNAAATVAAACSLPGEKNTVVVFSDLG